MLDTLGVPQVDVVAYSMGTFAATRLLGSESRLRSVALCGIGPWFIEGQGDALDTHGNLASLGHTFQSNEWNEHPEHKGMRACARLDPIHDFESIGAALIGLDLVPPDCTADVTVPVLVLNGATTMTTAMLPP